MVPDAEIVKVVQLGDRSAFGELVKRHQQAIYRLALRFTGDHGIAEDITQETFVKAFQSLTSFEFRSSFKSWLFRIAINNSKNKLRSIGSYTLDIEDVVVIQTNGIEQSYDFKTMSERLYGEVQKLPQRQKTALMLRIYEDLSFQEIAGIMECPYDTAKANFRHGILKIKESIDPDFFDELSRIIDGSSQTQVRIQPQDQAGD